MPKVFRRAALCFGLALSLAATTMLAVGNAESVATAGAVASQATDQTGGQDDATVAGGLTLVVRLSNPQGSLAEEVPVVPLEHNVRLRVLAHITRVTAGESPWPAGSDVTFIVHSPARTFGASGYEGRFYVLTLKPAGENPWGLEWELAAVLEIPAEH